MHAEGRNFTTDFREGTDKERRDTNCTNLHELKREGKQRKKGTERTLLRGGHGERKGATRIAVGIHLPCKGVLSFPQFVRIRAIRVNLSCPEYSCHGERKGVTRIAVGIPLPCKAVLSFSQFVLIRAIRVKLSCLESFVHPFLNF